MTFGWAFVHCIAFGWNGMLLGGAIGELVENGNLVSAGHATETLSTVVVLLFLAGLGCSLACAWRALTLEARP